MEASVCPMQDASLYAFARARGCWSTDAAWAKPSLREQRHDPVGAGYILPSKQECPRTILWWLRRLPTACDTYGLGNELTWRNKLVTNIKWKMMHKINTQIWSLAWIYSQLQADCYHLPFTCGKKQNFCSGTFEIPVEFLSVTSRKMLFTRGWMSVLTAVGKWSGVVLSSLNRTRSPDYSLGDVLCHTHKYLHQYTNKHIHSYIHT